MDKEEKENSLAAVAQQIRRKKMAAIECIVYGDYAKAMKACSELAELDEAITIISSLKGGDEDVS